MKVFHSDQFELPLPAGHRFPIDKYQLLRQEVEAERQVLQVELFVPEPASDEQLLRVHTRAYLEKIKNGSLTEKEIRQLGFPWSPQLVIRSRYSVGGTISTCRTALLEGISVNLAGGTHHAYPDHGEGFCVFNDVAVAIKANQAEDQIQRVLVLDCDVHQGNGTSATFQKDPSVFTLDIHGEKNYPFHKEPSSLDIPLPDRCTDEIYLYALRDGLKKAIQWDRADLAIYLAGADPFAGDRLGRLGLSKAGLAERDKTVFEGCCRAGLPVGVVMAGGYAKNIQDTVDIHMQTVQIASFFFGR